MDDDAMVLAANTLIDSGERRFKRLAVPMKHLK
jgi:hypothetical protein